MKLRTLLGLFAAAALAISAVAGYAVWHAAGDSERAQAEQDRARTAARQMSSLLVLTQEYARGFDERAAQQWTQKHTILLEQFARSAATTGAGQELVSLRQTAHALGKSFGMLAASAHAPRTSLAERRTAFLVDQLLTDTQALTDDIFRWAREAVAAQSDAEHRFQRTAALALVLLVLLLSAQGAVVATKVRRLKRLEAVTMAVAAGDLAARVGFDSRDELGMLGQRFDHMTEALASREAALKASEQVLREQSATLASITEAIPAIVAVVGVDGRYRFVNKAFERWRGLSRDAIVGHTLGEVLGDVGQAQSQPWVERVLRGESVSFERDDMFGEHRRHLSLSYIPLRLPDGAVDGFVGMVQDITVHKTEEVRLLRLAERDALTGVLNRHGFENYLARHDDEGLALLYIDLDRFKPVNDSHGHPVGDEVLCGFADRLQRLVRPTDAVARLGGDEFALVLPGVREYATAEVVADKVVRAAQETFEVGALRLQIGASVGVALAADDGWQGLVARADAAVYRAKAAGRGQRA